MPDPFDETLVAAADAFFLLPGTEYVTYVPASGSSRRIQSVISRPGAEPLPDVDGGSVAAFEVLVKNDPSKGISSDEIDTGGDRIKVAPNVNEIPKSMRIVEIVNHDAGHLLLRMQG